jgi:hypothetical protein
MIWLFTVVIVLMLLMFVTTWLFMIIGPMLTFCWNMFICCRRLFATPTLTPSTGAIIVPPVGVGYTGTVVFVIGFGGGVGGVVGGATGGVVVLPVGCDGGTGAIGPIGATGSVPFGFTGKIGFGGGVGGVVGGATGRVPFGFTGKVLFPIGVNAAPVGVVAVLVELTGCVTFVAFVILVCCGLGAIVLQVELSVPGPHPAVGVGAGVGCELGVVV